MLFSPLSHPGKKINAQIDAIIQIHKYLQTHDSSLSRPTRMLI